MSSISKKLKRTAKAGYRKEKAKSTMTWAIKEGDLVKDRSGDVGLALNISNNHCYLMSPAGYRWVKIARLLKISTDV